MIPPQLIVVEEVLPEVRRRIARSLYKENLSQEKIATLLGTSQAMVSRYLKEDRSISDSLEGLVDQVHREILVAALAGKEAPDLTDLFCSIVDASFSEGMLDERYRERFGTDLSSICRGPGSHMSSRAAVLEDLSTAMDYLLERPIQSLIPAVKVNIAYGLPGSSSLSEIASFPGRISDRNGRLMGPLPPEFGVSRHLAGMVLRTMEKEERARACISLRYDDKVNGALGMIAADPVYMKREPGGSTFGPVQLDPTGFIYIVDPGDFGIEPCLYIFGRSPLDVVHKAVEIQRIMDQVK